MPIATHSLSLGDATRMIGAALLKADELKIAYNVAVVGGDGVLLAFARQDGALPGCVDLALGKAATARLFEKTTEELSTFAQPGAQLYGIQQTNGGHVVIFGGGLPVRFQGIVIGAVGTSAGTVEQDISVAEAAVAALGF